MKKIILFLMKRNDATQFWLRYSELAPKDLVVILKTNINQPALSNWKKKKIFPRADEACLIADALNTSVEYLVKGKDENRKDVPAAAGGFAVDSSQVTEKDLQIFKTAISAIRKIIRKFENGRKRI